VKFYDFLPPSEIQRYMYFTDIHLIINDIVYHYAYGTKVFDAFMYKKPILLICKEESLYELTAVNRIGLATNNSKEQNEKLMDTLLENFTRIKNGTFFNREFDYSRFNLNQLTKKYIKFIESL
jgi:hypothetical protein